MDKFRSNNNQKRLETHTPATSFKIKDSDIYDSSFHSFYSAKVVSVLGFEAVFTDSLTGLSLSDDTHSNALDILIPAEREILLYVPLKFENDARRKTLLDTGACANAMPAHFHEKLKTQCPISISELQQASLLNVKVASGRTVKVIAQVNVKFNIIEHQFDAVFHILRSMNSVVIGIPFFKKYNIEISPGENLLKLTDMTYQINEIKIPSHGKKKIPRTKYLVCIQQFMVIKPQQQEILYAKKDDP